MSSPTEARRLSLGSALVPKVLGAFILAAIAALALYFVIQAADLQPVAVSKSDSIATPFPNQVSGTGSTISGVDSKKRPFEIRAASGQQDARQDNLIHLQKVDGDLKRADGTDLKVSAETARYDDGKKALELKGNVIFGEAGKFDARMESATVDVEKQTLQSNAPVEVELQGSTVKADSLTVNQDGSRIVFKGGVKARFQAKTDKQGVTP